MIQALEIKVGNMFIRELHTSRGLEYDHEFILTEEWMGKLFSTNLSIALQDLFPIPLTSEILEKCGFSRGDNLGYNNNFWHIRIGFCGLMINPDNGVVWICKKDEQLMINAIDLKHLHQLQNLYFALTGTELPPTL